GGSASEGTHADRWAPISLSLPPHSAPSLPRCQSAARPATESRGPRAARPPHRATHKTDPDATRRPRRAGAPYAACEPGLAALELRVLP
ncbi:unnamed protein product, partial [Urochloa humidicola]